jgi:hypothetical protein
MRLIVEVRLEGAEAGTPEAETRVVAVIDREDHSVSALGLTLAEGRALLAKVQTDLVAHQTTAWLAGRAACMCCGAPLAHKDNRTIVMRTVFGKVALPSPRRWVCPCGVERGEPRRSSSPMAAALPRRATPELEYLQAKWAAHLPYRQAAELLCEVLPLDKGISLGGIRRGVLDAGRAIDAEIEHGIGSACLETSLPGGGPVIESTSVGCVSVDSAWLHFRSSPRSRKAARDRADLMSPMAMKYSQERHVNIVAGRATFTDRSPRLYAYVHKLVPSAAGRLDQFLRESNVAPHERVTVICDDAGEFAKAVAGSKLARGRILDWFHIAMKFRTAERSVFGSQTIEWEERDTVEQSIRSAKWLVWNGKGSKAVARIKALDASLLARENYEDSTLYWNLRRLYFYVENNAGTLVNYGARYRKGMAISSSIAESAVNQVVSHRMAKKQQMRWTDEGAHCLAQVRVADLNGEFSVGRLSAALRQSAPANAPQVRRAA